MSRRVTLIAAAITSVPTAAFAQTAPFFQPLIESAPVTAPNSGEERNAPWVAPAGVSQHNLTSMNEIEADPNQSVGRAPDVPALDGGEPSSAGAAQSMWDMAAFGPLGRYLYIPHESPWSAGLTRYDRYADEAQLLWSGDGQGASGDWSNDFGAFDPATFTPNCTVFAAEEWTGEGRVMETLNPFAPVDEIEVRELDSIANTSHEGLQFSHDAKTLYFVDEWNSGSIYKFVTRRMNDYTQGQTFVLVVDDFAGNPEDMWNDESNVGQPRTGKATWVPITDKRGHATTTADPFRNGPTNDPRTNDDTRGGRPAADEVNGTPYGRPEDMEIGRLANGKEVMYFAATSERTIYTVEMRSRNRAMVRAMVTPDTPTNLGFPATTGTLNSPDNLAQDALGNLYVIEDAPNGSQTGGDIWLARDVDDDGVAESIDHFLSLRVGGSEATGMIFNPAKPTQFVVNVQHPASTNLDEVPGGFGDAVWEFDVSGVADRKFVRQLRRAGWRDAWDNVKMAQQCAKNEKKRRRSSRR